MSTITFKDPTSSPKAEAGGEQPTVSPNQALMDSVAVKIQTESVKAAVLDTGLDIVKVLAVVGTLYLLKRKLRPIPKSITRWKPKVIIPDSRARKMLQKGSKALGTVGKLAIVADLIDAGSDILKVCSKEQAISFAESKPIYDMVPWMLSATNRSYVIDTDVAKGLALSMMCGATKLESEKQQSMASPVWNEAKHLLKMAYDADLAGESSVMISWPEGYEDDRSKFISAWTTWFQDVGDSDLMIDIGTLLYNPTRVLASLPKLSEIVKTIIFIL